MFIWVAGSYSTAASREVVFISATHTCRATLHSGSRAAAATDTARAQRRHRATPVSRPRRSPRGINEHGTTNRERQRPRKTRGYLFAIFYLCIRERKTDSTPRKRYIHTNLLRARNEKIICRRSGRRRQGGGYLGGKGGGGRGGEWVGVGREEERERERGREKERGREGERERGREGESSEQ